MGSRENLKSPQSPTDGGLPLSDWGPPGSSRKNSLVINDTGPLRRQSVQEVSSGSEHQQTTSEIFKDLLSQKRNMLLSKLTSFDSDVSELRFFLLFFIYDFGLMTVAFMF